MVLDQNIQRLVCERIGCELANTSQYEALSGDIFRVTKEHLSVNTLKRLFGVLSEVETSRTTLNIIARYVGYTNWRLLQKSLDGDNSSFTDIDTFFPKEQSCGQKFTVSYAPDRVLILRLNEDRSCEVLSSSGGKLLAGDLLDIQSITLKMPFEVNEVVRNGVSMGHYVGGIEGGVRNFDLID